MAFVPLLDSAASSENTPWIMVSMGAAIAGMWGVLVYLVKGSIDRCESRDAEGRKMIFDLLKADAEKTAALKEANATAIRATDIAAKAAEVAEKSVSATLAVNQMTAENGKKLDALATDLSDMEKRLDSLTGNDPPAKRRA